LDSIEAPLRPRRRRWVVKTFCAGLALALVLMLSRTPAAGVTPPPTSSDVNAARGVYQRVAATRQQSKAQHVRVSWQELAAVAALGGRAAGFERVKFGQIEDRAELVASMPLPLGFWLNGHAYARSGDNGALRVSGRLGHLPVPAFITHGLINVARKLLQWRGAEVPPLESMVHYFSINDTGLSALVDLPGKSKVFSALSGLQAGAIDPERVADHYCRLVAQQKAEPDPDLVVQINRAFAAGEGSVADNRSLFVALSLLVASTDVGSISSGNESIFERCGRVDTEFQTLGRSDLPKHWAVSAALTSAFGSQASNSVGTWKEISDSGEGGSGFSLVDLAADRSGTFSAQWGTDKARSKQVQQWLARASQADLLPFSALALAEGMTEAQFQSRYASTDSAQYAATVERIDKTLAAAQLF
jgi:hypothetical protein